jgi:hypothetical protein
MKDELLNILSLKENICFSLDLLFLVKKNRNKAFCEMNGLINIFN